MEKQQEKIKIADLKNNNGQEKNVIDKGKKAMEDENKKKEEEKETEWSPIGKTSEIIF